MGGCVAISSDLTEARFLAEAGRLEEAAECCRRALARDVADLQALLLLGAILLRAGNAVEAVPLLATVAEQCPEAAILHALGEALYGSGLPDEAELRWRAAVALRPDLTDTWVALGNLRLLRDAPEEAEQCYRSAIASRRDCAEALNNLGNALVAQLRLEEAWQSYQGGLALRPGNADTGFAYALALLLGGEFRAGWQHFESRRQVSALLANYHRRPELPRWQPGMTMRGRRVLVMAEQGAGDIIQFARYATMLAQHGAEVILELPADLHPVLSHLPGVMQTITLEDPTPDCDIACPLLSLPLYFATDFDSVPATVPYAVAPPAYCDRWRAWIGERRGRRIGVVCSGRPDHPHDRHRSVPLERLLPILTLPGCEFVLLQPQLRMQDQTALQAVPSLRWPGAQLRDYGDTAGLLMQLDLLLTVDTSVAHLAGALARPVSLMLPAVPDYRWLLGRNDSPWYPTMRLFRQPARGDWDTVIAAVRDDLLREQGTR